MNDPVKAKIIELVGEAEFYSAEYLNLGIETPFNCRPITLADVLRAIQKECSELYGVRPSSLDKDVAMFMYFDSHAVQCETLNAEWNLTTDYDGQTQEVRTFIGKLLGIES